MLFAIVDDPLGQGRPDAGQGVELVERRGVDVDECVRCTNDPAGSDEAS